MSNAYKVRSVILMDNLEMDGFLEELKKIGYRAEYVPYTAFIVWKD